ncbi:hypothetical protein B0H10DRAFT_657882 [Mycena sp. CBHHK59/15]|nr:hypothetical protein B0H10DRAFT_657882 [Mycena sp. CBHHK59/15]
MSFLRQSFVPVYASHISPFGELGTNSMLIGGSVVYLKPDEAWPTCPTCTEALVPLLQLNASSRATPDQFRALLPSVVPGEGTVATMVQLFVCRTVPDCYDKSTTYSTTTRSWLVRIADVPVGAGDGRSSHRAEPRTKIEQGMGFLPAKLVAGWEPGKEETLDEELLWGQDDSDEFYAAHEPESGLKLLGHSVRGKYHCAEDCPKPGRHEHPSWRELIQLGDRLNCEWEEDEALEIMATIGNTWIEQCAEHPDVLLLSMSGNW